MMTNFRVHSLDTTAWRGIAVAVALVLAAGCGSDGDTGPAPEETPPIESLFDRFEMVEVLDADALVFGSTRIRFFPDGSSRALVAVRDGRVSYVDVGDADGTGAEVLQTFPVPGLGGVIGDLGLTAVVFDPDFASNGYVYFGYSTGDDLWNRVIRMTWNSSTQTLGSEATTILEISRETPVNPWHGLYALEFAPDGSLYVAVGEATQDALAQDPMNLNGKLLRIIPEDAGGYSIPSDNPYVGDPTVRDEIAALGLRSPFRMTRWGDGVFFGDVGFRTEELNYYPGPTAMNFGWPDCDGPCGEDGKTDPLVGIDRDDTTFRDEDPIDVGTSQRAIGVGVVYDFAGEDPYDDLLDGRILFYDVYEGWVRAADVLADGSLGPSVHVAHQEWLMSFDVGPDGTLYALQLAPQEAMYRVRLKPAEEE